MTGNQLALTNLPKVATPEAAAHIKQCLTPFRALRARNETELAEAARAIEYLSQPAPGEWIAGKVVTLLSHYFTAQQEASVAKAIARDWAEMLAEYPAWAIANACRWWMGRENPRRSFKPVPGDIQDRAHIEMEAVRAAKIMVGMGVLQEATSVAGDVRKNRSDEISAIISGAANRHG